MRIGTFSFDDGPDRVGILSGENQVVDVERLLGDGIPSTLRRRATDVVAVGPHWWLTPPGLSLNRELLATAAGSPPAAPVIGIEQIRVRPPITDPGKILAAGRNYLDHVAEGQRIWAERGRRVERPPFPSGFVKLRSALVGDGDAIRIPSGVDTVDYEIELGVVIGSPAHDVSVGQALGHVAGYTIANDVAARSIQLAEMEQLGLLVSKNFPTFAPMGPWITTTDDVVDPQNLEMTLRVNGEMRQRATTRDMLFTVAELIADWSRIGLEPGDILLTGTPSGVALSRKDPAAYYLRDGDIVTAEIGGLGELRNPVRSADPRLAGTTRAAAQASPPGSAS